MCLTAVADRWNLRRTSPKRCPSYQGLMKKCRSESVSHGVQRSGTHEDEHEGSRLTGRMRWPAVLEVAVAKRFGTCESQHDGQNLGKKSMFTFPETGLLKTIWSCCALVLRFQRRLFVVQSSFVLVRVDLSTSKARQPKRLSAERKSETVTCLVRPHVPDARMGSAMGCEPFVQGVRHSMRECLDRETDAVVGRIEAAGDGPGEHGSVELQAQVVMLAGRVCKEKQEDSCIDADCGCPGHESLEGAQWFWTTKKLRWRSCGMSGQVGCVSEGFEHVQRATHGRKGGFPPSNVLDRRHGVL